MNHSASPLRVGGIILCGGQSRRMGLPKLSLPFGNEVLLTRVCRIVAQAVSPIVVVAAVDQALPELPSGILVARDEFDSLGPLAGLATGLDALRNTADAAFVTSCDVPLLRPAVIHRLTELLGSHAAVVPTDGRYDHVLCSVFRTNLADQARDLVNARRLRPLFLIEESHSLRIPVETLRDIDPDLESLRNANTPEDYLNVLRLAGLPDVLPPGLNHTTGSESD